MSANKTKGPLYDPGLCRCCGNMKKCRLLNGEYHLEGETEVYSDMILDCFGILLCNLDGKPLERLICATCVVRLREALAFRKQVLYWEEALLQMKMTLDEGACSTKPNYEVNELFDGPSKLEVEVVKQEPTDDDAAADNGSYDDLEYQETKPIKRDLESTQNDDSNDDVPLIKCKTNSKIQIPKQETENIKNEDSTPLRKQNKINLLKARKKSRVLLKKKISKENSDSPSSEVLMSAMQLMNRERDPTYKIENNLLVIVEFSYVCPFRCRHNNLLCYYCGQLYTEPEKLRNHTLEHTPHKFKVTEHKNMVKIDITRIDCRLCTEKIDSLEDFKKHISSVHGKKYYFDHSDSVLPFRLTSGDLKCALCDVVFLYFHALNKHMNEHFSNYVCETCGLGFVDKGRFVMHQIRHEDTNFPCEICGKIFKAQYNKDLHVDRVHNRKGRVYCPKCDVKLMSYAQKLKHLVEVHGEEPLSFSCNICKKVFDKRRTLTIHVRKEHLKDFRYECRCCGQKFFTRFALTNHMPVHTGERNFKCKVCEKSYPRLKTLKDHMRIHTNDRRYRCDVCGQAFIQNCSLKGHIKSQHPEYG